MAFHLRDLSFAIDPASDRSWMLVIGCGAASVVDHVNTQVKRARHDAIDLMHGVKTLDDINALRQELNACLEKLKIIEADVKRLGGVQPAAPGGGGGGGNGAGVGGNESNGAPEERP
jgi:hypothetical protein